jgi:uncharacterized membrane protein YfcA
MLRVGQFRLNNWNVLWRGRKERPREGADGRSRVSRSAFDTALWLVVGLTPAQAIGAGLLTEVFGMGNGLRADVKQGVVDYRTAKWLLAGAVPAVVVGAVLAHYVDPTLLKLAFGAGLVVLGSFLVYYTDGRKSARFSPASICDEWPMCPDAYHRPVGRFFASSDPRGPNTQSTKNYQDRCPSVYDPPEEYEPGEHETDYLAEKNTQRGKTRIESTAGETFVYDTCWRPPGVGLSTVGGFITGLISAGLPEIVTTQLIVRCRLPPRVAVATSVFTLGIAAGAGALVHALSATPVWWVVAWSAPGVIIGGTIGTRVAKYVPSDLMEVGLGIVFTMVGLLVLGVELGA